MSILLRRLALVFIAGVYAHGLQAESNHPDEVKPEKVKRNFMLTVSGTDHVSGTVGKYFNFDWQPAMGTDMHGGDRWEVMQCRNGEAVWKGAVRMWHTVDGGSTGNAHGRLESGADKNQWSVSDVITTAASCPAASKHLDEIDYVPLNADVLTNSQELLMKSKYYAGEQMLDRSKDPAAYVGLPVFVAFIFALIYGYTYSANSDKVEWYTGLKMTHLCCVVYATLSICIDLSIKNAAQAYGGHFPFNPACGVIVVEYVKFALSAALFAVHCRDSTRGGRVVAMPQPIDIAWLAVPAAIYAMNNLIVFQAIKSTPLATFGVLRETMLVWNALIWTATFGKSLSAARWLAIAGIFIGCSLNQITKMMNDEWSSGVFWTLLLAFSNAAGAVANEYAMKQRAQLDINLQNCILYAMCGSFVLIGMTVFDPASVESTSSFFNGFVPECWQVIILQVFTGLAVSRILKYVEAVTKTIVAALRGPGVIFFGACIFKTQLQGSEVFATLIVCASCYLYLSDGPLVAEPSKDEHTSLLCKTKATA